MLLLETVLEALVEALTPSRELSQRGQLWIRLLFGLLLAGLGVVGAVHVWSFDEGLHLRLAAAVLFFFLACFGLFNVALGRQWRWPGCLFVISLGMLFLVRILFGR